MDVPCYPYGDSVACGDYIVTGVYWTIGTRSSACPCNSGVNGEVVWTAASDYGDGNSGSKTLHGMLSSTSTNTAAAVYWSVIESPGTCEITSA